MKCPNCNGEVPEGKRFCGHCGHKLEVIVPFDDGAATRVGESPWMPKGDADDDKTKVDESPIFEKEDSIDVTPVLSNDTADEFPIQPQTPAPPRDEIYQTVDAPGIEKLEIPSKAHASEPVVPLVTPPKKRKRGKWVWGLVGGMALIILITFVWVNSLSDSQPETINETVMAEALVEVTSLPVSTSNSMPSVPSFVTELLRNATISKIEEFDTLPDDWHGSLGSIKQDSANGRVHIPEDEGGDGIHLNAPYEIEAGEAILILFQFDTEGDLITMLETGTWETSTYRRWGLLSTVGFFRTDTYLGADWQGEPILEGSILAKADTWYYLLLAVGPQGRFAMQVWERDDLNHSAQYWELDESQWENKKWFFLLQNWGGDVYLDSFSIIKFSDFRELSQAEIHFWTGKEYNREGDYQAAFDEYSKAIDHDDKVPYYFRKRGLMNCSLGNNDACLSDHFTALEIDPENYYVLRNLAIIYQDMGDFDKASNYASRVIQVAPELSDGYSLMADAKFYLAEDPASAVIDYSLAIERYSESPTLYRDRCIAYNALEEYSAAFEDCSRCLELNPEYDGCYWDRGWANNGLGNTSAAVRDFETYLELVAPDDCPECQKDAQDYIDQHSP